MISKGEKEGEGGVGGEYLPLLKTRSPKFETIAQWAVSTQFSLHGKQSPVSESAFFAIQKKYCLPVPPTYDAVFCLYDRWEGTSLVGESQVKYWPVSLLWQPTLFQTFLYVSYRGETKVWQLRYENPAPLPLFQHQIIFFFQLDVSLTRKRCMAFLSRSDRCYVAVRTF